MPFFSKTNVMIKFLHNLALLWVKNAIFFANFLGENIIKNRSIGPWPEVEDWAETEVPRWFPVLQTEWWHWSRFYENPFFDRKSFRNKNFLSLNSSIVQKLYKN
jgi:hypothetical protein